MNAKIVSYTVFIKETYLDSFGHVNNAMYLTLFEEARWDLITKNGYGIQKIKETGIGPTILEIKLIFSKELKARDEVVIETQLISYEKKILKIMQRMIRSGEICCIAEFTMALFSLTERKIILPTSDWLEAIGAEKI